MELARILRAPDVREMLRTQGSDPKGSTPDEASRFFRNEVDKWARVVKASGLQPE